MCIIDQVSVNKCLRWFLQFQLNRDMVDLLHILSCFFSSRSSSPCPPLPVLILLLGSVIESWEKRWWWIFMFLWSYLTAPWQQRQGNYMSNANYAFKSTIRFGIGTHYKRHWWYEMSSDNRLLNQSEYYIFVGVRITNSNRKCNSVDLEIKENHIGSSN